MHKYDTPHVNQLISNGSGKAGNAIRGWFRQGRISGAFQREKNAKIWFSPEGVREAWELWAEHQGLDVDADMPDSVREIIRPVLDVAGGRAVDAGVVGQDAQGGGTHVHFRVPAGSTLTISVTGTT